MVSLVNHVNPITTANEILTMPTIAVLGTLDTKAAEHAFVADCIRWQNLDVLMIDVGTGDPPGLVPDITRDEVAVAGGIDLPALIARHDRGECVTAMASAAPKLLQQLQQDGRIDGIIALGGSGGSSIASAAMRALPIGFPKVLVSTVAASNAGMMLGTKDIVLVPSIVDASGLNRISRRIFSQAAAAVCGMVMAPAVATSDRPLIVASMFGNTTKCVTAAAAILEQAGYEVLTFHCTGVGGRTMESLIESGLVAGVLDVTTTELADELVGGVLSAGPDRMLAATRAGVPAIVTPGCLDMVNFGEPSTIPPHFAGRRFYVHNPQITLMRTTPDECRQLGEQLARNVNASTAPVTVLLPLRGISVISAAGGPFADAEADAQLFDAIRQTLRPETRVVEMDCEINAPEFAAACAKELLANVRMMGKR